MKVHVSSITHDLTRTGMHDLFYEDAKGNAVSLLRDWKTCLATAAKLNSHAALVDALKAAEFAMNSAWPFINGQDSHAQRMHYEARKKIDAAVALVHKTS